MLRDERVIPFIDYGSGKGILGEKKTDERYVIYRALYGTQETWVRPFAMFMEEVDRAKYPQVAQKFRFEKYEGPVVR